MECKSTETKQDEAITEILAQPAQQRRKGPIRRSEEDLPFVRPSESPEKSRQQPPVAARSSLFTTADDFEVRHSSGPHRRAGSSSRPQSTIALNQGAALPLLEERTRFYEGDKAESSELS